MPKSDKLRVSIIVPCYNAARTLGETLESVLAQQESMELIVVDDGSTDGSIDVARGFEPYLRIISLPNSGASTARNRGIAQARAEWVVFLDADDLLAPGTLAKRLATAGSAESDVVVCDWQDMPDDNSEHAAQPVRSLDWDQMQVDAEAACAGGVWATTAALMYRRSLVERIGGFRMDLPVIQDARLMFDAAYHGGRFAHSRHVGAYYRILPNSLSRRDPGKFWRDVLTNGEQIEALWRLRGTLSERQIEVAAGIYDHAARGLFAAGHADYFQAVGAQRRLGASLPLHPRIAEPLARGIGLHRARSLLGLLGR